MKVSQVLSATDDARITGKGAVLRVLIVCRVCQQRMSPDEMSEEIPGTCWSCVEANKPRAKLVRETVRFAQIKREKRRENGYAERG